MEGGAVLHGLPAHKTVIPAKAGTQYSAAPGQVAGASLYWISAFGDDDRAS
jgi:hypothetical protein